MGIRDRAAAVEQLSLRKALPLNNGAQIVIGADTDVYKRQVRTCDP